MLELTKAYLFVILSTITLSITGCEPSTGREYLDETIQINAFVEHNNSIYIYYSKPNVSDMKMMVFESSSGSWNIRDVDTEIVNTDTIMYSSEKVMVKKDKKLIFEDSLPNIEKIEESLGVSLKDYDIKYTPYRAGRSFSWDQKIHIVSVGADKYSKGCNVDTCYETMYYLSVAKNSDDWDINLIFKRDKTTELGFLNGFSMFHVKENVFETFSNKVPQYITNVFRLSTDENQSFCFVVDKEGERYCLVKRDDYIEKVEENNPISLNEEKTRYKIKDFWHNNQYHVFYDLESTNKNRGKYIKYEMYTKENPTTPINQQKIYW